MVIKIDKFSLKIVNKQLKNALKKRKALASYPILAQP